MKILNPLILAAVLAAASVPAFAQGGSPYNNSGSQAGGPLAGQQREMGAPGAAPAARMAPRKQRSVHHRRARHHRAR
ncbi:hypothetical protein OPKNFCMD_0041 [Methylobacterium crusticola]|uniref:Uncharacterized protein n=1 Tax=Methylobacterium crusticola TaxID=1697972 RepID=A0ABQ4QRA8_9HYPH|nr:hypothetical protein [Methylobacterium crusticola]GJD47335.1 hypothetical protein OPKNFCMD_0041 [Methylobacterium crusticola]